MYKVKATYYSDSDQFGESFVLTSDNLGKNLNLEIGQKVKIIPICMCGNEAVIDNRYCRECREQF